MKVTGIPVPSLVTTIVLLLNWGATGGVHGATSFSDDTFPSSVWKQVRAGCGIVADNTFGTSFAEAGNPKPSWWVATGIPNDASSLIQIFWSTNAVFDPQSQGAITSIDYSLDSILGAITGAPISIRPALRQNSKWYLGSILTPGGSWTRHEAAMLLATDFGFADSVTCQVITNQNPDFSAAGSTTDFGFAVVHEPCTGCSGVQRHLFIDNWSVTINPDAGPARTGLSVWTVRNSGTTNNLHAAGFGNGLFVAVGAAGSILTSPDGSSWTSRESGTSNALRGVAHGDGQLAVVGDRGTILVSSNGISWSLRDSGTTNNLTGIAFGAGRFVAVGFDAILASTGGLSWSSQPWGLLGAANAVSFGRDRFVAVGARFAPSGQAVAQVGISTNGLDWDFLEPSGVVNLYPTAVIYANDQFVAGASKNDFSLAAVAMSSSDGRGWEWRLLSVASTVPRLAGGNGALVAASQPALAQDSTLFVRTSAGGWEAKSLPGQKDILGITFGHDTFVAVGEDGIIFQSDIVVTLGQPQVTGSGEFQMLLFGPADRLYRIQTSSNLVDWQAAAELRTTNSVQEFRHPSPTTNEARFYRVWLP